MQYQFMDGICRQEEELLAIVMLMTSCTWIFVSFHHFHWQEQLVIIVKDALDG